MELDASQERAVDLICSVPFGIITGNPGTGKSTCLRVALDRLDSDGVTYALASPTGKAAKRMTEATGREASTIHRLLGWQRGGWSFNANNPLPFDVIIIDEASMLCIELADALVDAIADDTRIILVGDADQLPSVGPGRVLADLVEGGIVPVARLTHVHRAAAESWICRNAPKVLTGEGLKLEDCPDFRFVEADDAAACAAAVQRLVREPHLRNAQVLAPQRTTLCGVEALNVALQAQLNPRRSADDEWKVGEQVFRKGDRVIQTQNAYGLVATNGTTGVFNGEVGDVIEIGEQLVVDFGDRQVPYTKSEAFGLQLAYALTVHKSQGSEFPWVICVVHSAHSYMLNRPLFYTAITRAKKGVIIVGNRKGLHVATSAKEPPKRNTALVARMRDLVLEDVGSEFASAPAANDTVDALAKTAEDDLPW